MAKSKGKNKKTSMEEHEKGPDVKKGENFETINGKIKAIGENPDHKTSPIIGYFPSGYDPPESSDDPDSTPEPVSSVKVYRSVNSRNPKSPRMEEVVVGVSGCQVNFVGTDHSGEARAPQLCNYALGVLDKETRVLKMVPIASNRIFRLEPKLRALEPENKQPDEAKEGADEEEEKADKFRTLTIMYSSKKNIERDKNLKLYAVWEVQ